MKNADRARAAKYTRKLYGGQRKADVELSLQQIPLCIEQAPSTDRMAPAA